ncbi:MAG: quinolinate synthase NadA [Proteobacteria bacterium]|nr:quinolinate synthase NadA [Candidatus Fonsibacter sp. PEL4]
MSSQLEFTKEIKKNTAGIYQKIKSVVPALDWPLHAPYIYKINELKKKKNAVILAHNYQTPEIYHGVADIIGDSLTLAIEAGKTKADIKIMSPNKKVLIPDLKAGCSLAESITAEDVRKLKKQHPGVPVVTYVNTSAEVKAETDVCCTSANGVKVVESLGVKEVIFLPDVYLAKYVASQTKVKIIPWHGTCMVHEQFTAEELNQLRNSYPGLVIVSHPECPPDVIKASDFTGSTSGMIQYVKNNKPKNVFLVTECSMSDNVQVENPEINFVRPCNLCPHMKRIQLPKIYDCLINETNEVLIDKSIIEKAKLPIERMIKVGRQSSLA